MTNTKKEKIKNTNPKNITNCSITANKFTIDTFLS
jgi:hypothetical protein